MNKFILINRILLGLIILTLLFFEKITIPVFWRNPRLAVMMDNSQSMGREEKKRKTMNILSLLRRKEGVKMDVFSFSDTILKGLPEKFEGKFTDFSKIIDFLRDKDYEGALIISDGFHNRGEFDFTKVKLLPLPLFTVGIEDSAFRDVFIKTIETKNLGKDSFRISLLIQSRGITQENVRATLKRKNERLDEKRFDIKDGELVEVNFSIYLKEEATLMHVEIDSLPSEINYKNNVANILLKNRAKLKVAYLNVIPYQGTKKWIRLLHKIDWIEPDFFIVASPSKVLKLEKEMFSKGVPQKEYDVLILDNFSEKRVLPELLKWVHSQADRNKAILITGDYIELSKMNSSPVRLERKIKLNGRAEIKFLGQGLFLFDKEKIREYLESIEEVDVFKSELMPETNVLLSLGNIPIVVKRGKIIKFLLAGLWASPFFEKELMENLITFAFTNKLPVKIVKGRKEYFDGEKIEFIFESKAFEGNENINATLYPPGTINKWVESNKLYVEILKYSPGAYTLSLNIDNTKVMDYNFFVLSTSVEDKDYGLNREFLQRLAVTTNGKYLKTPEDIFGIKLVATITLYPSNFLPFYLLFFVLFILELWFRRRRGLP